MNREAILLVDDDPNLFGVFTSLFGEDYHVLEASNGPDALTLLAARAPRLMVLDLTMPGIGDLELLKAAKTANPDLAVILLTRELDIPTARKALALGVSEFITKPFEIESLRDGAKRILDEIKT